MPKVIAIRIKDTEVGCVVLAYHITGKKRRVKWAKYFDFRDPLPIMAAVEEEEPRKPKTGELQGALT